MDFLDPKKQKRHAILLYTGYFLIGVAILISTTVLIYQANGFGVNSKGQVVQNGLVFFSSQPNPAKIYLNGKLNESQTNSRVSIAAGQYNVRLSRDGYRDWRRNITVQGGDVQNFDYPVLFPSQLTTKKAADYKLGAGLASQSRDRRWLVLQQPGTGAAFDIYDLKDPTTPTTSLTLPASVIKGATTGVQSWEAVQWADDNQHLVLRHTFTGGSEYIELDRGDATKAVNLNQALSANPALLTLIDNKYDQYHLLSAAGGDLSAASLGDPTPQKLLSNVISYKSYGSKTILYATSQNAPSGKTNIDIFDGNTSQLLRQVSAGTTYLLDMAGFRGSPYVVLGASSENIVYVYKDPLGQLGDKTITSPIALRAIKVANPNYVAFSPNTQYIVAQGGDQFGVYDIYLKHAYVYTSKLPLDTPQAHATWMDGNRLTYVSNGKQAVFDYDNRNVQSLSVASASYVPFFSPDYHYVYGLAPAASGGLQLSQTPLLTAADL